MRSRVLLCLFGLVVVSSANAGPGEPPLCEQLRVTIDLAKRQQALLLAEAGDRYGAARDTRQSAQSKEIVERVRWSLKLLEQSKCESVPAAPFSDGQSEYGMQALTCRTDESQGIQDSAACVLADWKPQRR